MQKKLIIFLTIIGIILGLGKINIVNAGLAPSWCHDFEQNLRFGDQGEEVMWLQNALQEEGFTIFTNEKQNAQFGYSTASAVVGFQEKYASEILQPLELEHGTGYVGPKTRAKLNALYGCPQPSITVISPNGGEEWEIGKTYEIRWESQNVEFVNIEIVWCHTGWEIAYRVSASSGKYLWTIPSSFEESSDYQIHIWDPDNTEVEDWSDGRFRIIKPVTCTDSDGGKNYYQKGTVTVDGTSYTDYCLDENRLIEYYCSNNQMRFDTYACSYGCENGACKKVQPKITVVSPNGGEEWEIGETYQIKWESQGIEKVMIQLSSPEYVAGGMTIARNIDADLGSYNIYLDPSRYHSTNLAKIEISSEEIIGGKYILDESDDYFTILKPITCTDSDGGENYYQKGTVTVNNVKLTDFCIDSKTLKEHYCVGSNARYSNYVCPYGCENGACRKQPACERKVPTVTIRPSSSTHNPGDYRGYGVYIKNNDSQGCGSSTFTLVKKCPSGWTCTLSRSSVTIGPGSTYGVTLGVTSPKNASPGTYRLTVTARNQKSGLSGEGEAKYIVKEIQQEDPVTGTLSSDKTTVKVGENVTFTISAQDDQGVYKVMAWYKGSWHSQYCNNAKECTKTFTFTESTPGTKYYYGYVYGRKVNGRLEGKYTTPSYVRVKWEEEITPTCTDSDGGKNYYQRGTVTVDGTKLTDFCINSRTLKEHYCVGSDARYLNYVCPYGCENGACRKQPSQQEDPVTGTLSVDKTKAKTGENITLTISAQDDQGVYKVMAYYKGKWHSQYCNNAKECTKTWTFTESTSGYPGYVKYYYGYVYGRKLNGRLEGSYTTPYYVKVIISSERSEKLPDLVIEDIFYQSPYIKVKYCNRGEGWSSSDFLIKLRNEATGKEYGGNSYYRFSVPQPGECKTTGGLTPGLIGLRYGQQATVTGIIDWEKRVKESNEENNRFTKTIGGGSATISLEEISSQIASLQEILRRLMDILEKP